MFKPTHAGLFFSRQQIEAAKATRDLSPIREAWELMRERQPHGTDSALVAAFRQVFDEDDRDLEAAFITVRRTLSEPPSPDHIFIDQMGEVMMLTQTIEMLRDHPAFQSQRDLFDLLRARVDEMTRDHRLDTLPEQIWAAALRFCAGVVLEDGAWTQSSVALFERVITEQVRPQGHITAAVELNDGGAMFRLLLCVSGLVLMAEAGAYAGFDLWSYSVRGVSVTTAAMYPIYYYYTTAKWQWDEHTKPEDVQALFARYGGYLEMLYRRNKHRDVLQLLQDMRPIYTPFVGGMTTLTHGEAEIKKKRRGLFGR